MHVHGGVGVDDPLHRYFLACAKLTEFTLGGAAVAPPNRRGQRKPLPSPAWPGDDAVRAQPRKNRRIRHYR